MTTAVWFRKSPVHDAAFCFEVPSGLTVAEILVRAETPDWFADHGGVYLDGEKCPDGTWSVRTAADVARVDLMVMPGSKKLLPILISVATIALTAGIGTFGLPFLGAGFAAGTLGASLAAAGVGLAGSLLVSALTAPPKIGQDGTQRQIGEAGATGNPIVKWDVLPNVLGTMLVSPPLLAPAYTWIDGDDTWTEVVVGLEGHYSVDADSVLINGLDVASFVGAEVEVREGGPSDTARTIAAVTVIEQRDGKKIENFKTESNSVYYERLVDQVTPDNSASPWVRFDSDGPFDEMTLRFNFPQGIAESGTFPAMVPLRVEIRKVGDVTWRKLPTFHFHDPEAGKGPTRGEIKLIRTLLPSGPHFSYAEDEHWPIFEVNAWTGIGQSYEYESDDYFKLDATLATGGGLVPAMTGTTTSGVTVTASSEQVGNEGWRAFDSGAGIWKTASAPGTVYLEIDFGAATYVGCYKLNNGSGDVATLPGVFWIEGWTGAAWVRLDDTDIDVRNSLHYFGIFQIGNPGSYSKYRLYVSDNRGDGTGQVWVAIGAMYSHQTPGCAVTDGGTPSNPGTPVLHSSNSFPRVTNVSLHRDGCDVYLDPAEWDAGAYEVRVKRGWSIDTVQFTASTYQYSAAANTAMFFEYVLDSGFYTIVRSQQDFRTETVVEMFSTTENVAPFDPSGISHIAVRVKNVVVDSVAAIFARRQRAVDGGVWSDTWAVSANPASQSRDILLGMSNPDPLPGELLDEDELKDWYARCVTDSRSCNAYVQGESIADVLQMIASCGYGAPRMANVWGVVQDYDTSAVPAVLGLSPINSRDLGTTYILPRQPHVVQVEFADASNDYKSGYALVYAAGYDVNTATRQETWQMRGFVSEATATARAAFDLAQVRARKARYGREIGVESYLVKRGDVVRLTCDTLDRKQSFAFIKSVTVTTGNVVSVTLDNIINWSVGQEGFEIVGDDFVEGQTMGIAIQLADGSEVVKTVTEISDSNVATFTTPFADDSSVTAGLMVVTGIAGREYRRCRVMAVESDGFETRRLELAEEAVSLFA